MKGRILIAGTHSGCGKTTVTLAILSALKARELPLAAFKCGPDYIDPMFHREALGVFSRNLDPFFCTAGQLRAALAEQSDEFSVIEGVMGYYDGAGPEGAFSTYGVARDTETPVILVINAKGMYASAGALLRGFMGFKRQSNVRGVIFNGVPQGHYEGLKQIAMDAGAVPLGFLPYERELSIGSRHLGLVTAGEIGDLQGKLRALGALAQEYIDIGGVLALAASAPTLNEKVQKISPIANVRVAVARDAAFCFLYEENLALLRALGCELCFFSPLSDTALPKNIGALYLPGGYPELHLVALAENAAMRSAVKTAVENGLPTLAECGGFLYLHDSLDGFPVAGVIPAKAYKTEKLQRFGYVTLTAKQGNLLCEAGESIRAHEFHYDESEFCGGAFTAQKPNGRAWDCIHASESLWAGFPHLYFPANASFAERFVRKANDYAQRHA
ncbi:MAG TPA: cobyrinate a,c-diamide synthase [Feifaniaceae bacterium]|nr:cobyrinate a,c-diamide synthase [Feifaniaceae bacterium]